MDACLRFQFHACTHPAVPIINGASFGINQGHKSCRAFVSSGEPAPPSGYIRGRFVHARILLSLFYFLFSLVSPFASTPPFLSLSLSPPSTDGLIQRGELNKQKVRLPGRRFRRERGNICRISLSAHR